MLFGDPIDPSPFTARETLILCVLKLQQDHSKANISPRRIPVARAMHAASAKEDNWASPESIAFFISETSIDESIVAWPRVRNRACL